MSLSGLPPLGRAYIAAVATLGAGTLAHSIYSLFAQPIGWNWFVLAALTLVTGSATVKLPSVPATISISETFVFTAALLYGPAAGTLTVALDALVISYSLARKGHPSYRILFNICALPASIWVGAHVFFWIANFPPLAFVAPEQEVSLGALIRPLIIFTACYFGLNSWSIALAISIERNLPAIRVWRENFAWLALNYFGGASVAALLVTYTKDIDYAFIAIVVPLLAVLYFTFSTALGRIEDTNTHLKKLNTLYMSTIETLAMAIDAKDQITHGHIRRVQHYAVGLARRVGVMTEAQISAIEAASLLHDMGKLAIPEYILNKPGPLSASEFEKMKLHASVGADILSAIDFPYPVVPIVRHHHENWDGSGYPDGLKGTEIPIGARVLAVVDCFDALTSDRPYRPRLSDEEAIRILLQRRGNMYDPVIVDTFISSHQEMTLQGERQRGPEPDKLATITESLRHIETKLPTAAYRFSQISASAEESSHLIELTQNASAIDNFENLGQEIWRQVRRLIPAVTCVVYRFADEDDELVAHAFGQHSAHFSHFRVARGRRLSGWIAANHQSVLNSDPVLELGESARALRPPLRSFLGVPLVHDALLVGVLATYSPEVRAFNEEHLRLLEAIATQISPTVSVLKRSADPGFSTSELAGPEALERFVNAQLADAGRVSTSIIEVSFQVAQQRVNSAASGEQIIAFAIRQALRPSDFLFFNPPLRFVCVLTATEHLAAERITSQVRQQFESLSAALGFRPAAVRVGYATAPRDGLTFSALLDKIRGGTESSLRPPSIH